MLVLFLELLGGKISIPLERMVELLRKASTPNASLGTDSIVSISVQERILDDIAVIATKESNFAVDLGRYGSIKWSHMYSVRLTSVGIFWKSSSLKTGLKSAAKRFLGMRVSASISMESEMMLTNSRSR